MKKILIILGLVVSGLISAQTPLDKDSLTNIITTTNAQYGLVFDDATKTIYYMTMDHYQPWLFNSTNLLYPRTTALNLSLGATTNPYSDRLYVSGTLRTTGNGFFGNRLYLGSLAYMYANSTTGEWNVYDPVNGNKTLAQLAAGGAATITEGNLINTVIGTSSTEVSVDENVIGYDPTMTTIYTGTLGNANYYVDQSSTGQYIIAAANGMGIRVSNDFGATFTETDSLRAYTHVSMSGSGKYILIGNANGYQLRSKDYGATFLNMPDSLGFYFADISHNGKYQAGTWGVEDMTTGYVFTSSDSGNTWRRRNQDFSEMFSDIEISDNGKYLAATTYDCDYCPSTGGIWVSSDSGATWTQKLAVGDMWNIAMSGNGRYQIATGYGTYKSSDYGATWTSLGVTSVNADISQNGKDQIIQTATNLRISGDYGLTWYIFYTDSYTGAQQISLSGEGLNVLYAEGMLISRYNTAVSIEFKKPVTALKETSFQDSVSYDLYDNGYEQWLLISATGTLVADSLGAAGFMNVMCKPSINEHFADMQMVNGLPEFAWWYKAKSGEIIKTWDVLSIKRPTYQVQALMSGIELNRWFIYNLNNDKEILERKCQNLQSEIEKLQKEYDTYKKSNEYRLSNIEADLLKLKNE
jgi:hypothetical protein